jgi:hypothetical protein
MPFNYVFTVTEKVIINCVSDDSSFTKEVFDYLYLGLEKQMAFGESKDIRINKELIAISEEDNTQIYVDRSTSVPNGMIKWILKSFLKSNPSKFKEYDVIEIADTFTIGRILHPSQAEGFLLSCEICGFFTPYSEELYTHRMTHYGIG